MRYSPNTMTSGEGEAEKFKLKHLDYRELDFFIVFSFVLILCTSSELETLKLQLMLDIPNRNAAAQPWGE